MSDSQKTATDPKDSTEKKFSRVVDYFLKTAKPDAGKKRIIRKKPVKDSPKPKRKPARSARSR